MRDKIGDGGKAEIQRGQGTLSGDDDAYGLAGPGRKGEGGGVESVGIHGTNSERVNSGPRPRPVTHGKTLSFLIQSLADQLRDSQEAQAREVARQVRIEQQLQQLREALDAWRASVADVVEDFPSDV
jgi:hypothetical protein